jgi:hypothetical protein
MVNPLVFRETKALKETKAQLVFKVIKDQLVFRVIKE